MKVSLIQLPTVAVKMYGYPGSSESGIYLGHVYREVMPLSLPRVASVIQNEVGEDVSILDLRIADPNNEEVYKGFDYEGFNMEARRVGASFDLADKVIAESDWIGLSAHFAFESHVVRDFIQHAKKLNPGVKVMVGGHDATKRPEKYTEFGADLVFEGDFNPEFKTGELYWHDIGKLTKPSFALLDNLESYIDSHDGPLPAGAPTPVGFIYFTRGCQRECYFCDRIERTYRKVDLESSISALEHYQKEGIKSLNIIDENLLLQVGNNDDRQKLIDLFRVMRDMGFAWEFPAGLEMGKLLRGSELDEELLQALFYRSEDLSGNITGCYRTSFPVETFDEIGSLAKLKGEEGQNKIIKWLVEHQILEVGFALVIQPWANEGTFESTRRGYGGITEIVANGKTNVRYGMLNAVLLGKLSNPDSEYYVKPKYSIDEFPELWHFYTPTYDGRHFTARQLFEKRMQLTKEIDSTNFGAMMRGRYGYGNSDS